MHTEIYYYQDLIQLYIKGEFINNILQLINKSPHDLELTKLPSVVSPLQIQIATITSPLSDTLKELTCKCDRTRSRQTAPTQHRYLLSSIVIIVVDITTVVVVSQSLYHVSKNTIQHCKHTTTLPTEDSLRLIRTVCSGDHNELSNGTLQSSVRASFDFDMTHKHILRGWEICQG